MESTERTSLRLTRTAAVLCLLLFLMQTAIGQIAPSAPVVTLVKAARLLDPRTGNIISPATFLI
jgi:hypothetical protein